MKIEKKLCNKRIENKPGKLFFMKNFWQEHRFWTRTKSLKKYFYALFFSVFFLMKLFFMFPTLVNCLQKMWQRLSLKLCSPSNPPVHTSVHKKVSAKFVKPFSTCICLQLVNHYFEKSLKGFCHKMPRLAGVWRHQSWQMQLNITQTLGPSFMLKILSNQNLDFSLHSDAFLFLLVLQISL